jgi:aspartokinase/homoserine dehydrogenase 1
MKVLKFGGTSVANAERIGRVKDIVTDTLQHSQRLVVVVSALGGLTDTLIETAKMAEAGNEAFREKADDIYYRHRQVAEALFASQEIGKVRTFLKDQKQELENLLHGIYLIKELSPRVLDCIMSYGEIMSSFIVAHYIAKFLPDVEFIDSRQVIKTDSEFGSARVDFELTNANLLQTIDKPKGVYVMGGFIASNDSDVTTTLGRGGSDYTAAIVGAALDVEEIEIWTDVDGVMTADPRKVKKAFSLTEMTYEEAMEMSHFGAKVIHPPTVQPALDKQIPLRIRNTFNPNFSGTLITSAIPQDNFPVKGITSTGDIALITVQGSGLIGVTGVAGRLFTALAREKTNIILITQASSEHSISFAVKPNDARKAKKAIEKEFAYELRAHQIDEVEIEDQLCVVAVIGSNMKSAVGIAGQMFSALGRNGVNIRAIAQGSSELNISTVAEKLHETKALNALHDAFFLSGTRSLNLFVVGTGLIATTLLAQIKRQQAYLYDKQQIDVRVIAATNSHQMLIDENGIDLAKWREQINAKGIKAELRDFVNSMIEMNLPNSVFVDCTAHENPVAYYEQILSNSISIVTPNKLANSGSYADYLRLHEVAHRHRAKFRYETNVGAGLPLISTLRDLMQSGDEVQRIEAVLSGSLSFIFNSFNEGTKFSDIVKEAQRRGFTEPDPRIDLSGMDVARKVLILSREIGQQIELSDINITNILPEACQKAKSIEDFFKALEANDDHFAQLRDQAKQKNGVLRFLAVIEKNKTVVSLQTVNAQNPFYSLSGSDNMIVFHTARYNERPLVVKGPGAGAEVTAAGVFAEIIAVSA